MNDAPDAPRIPARDRVPSPERGADIVVLQVPRMAGRADVRVISACVADTDGVVTLQVDLATKTVRVEGAVSPDAVRAAIAAAGYAVTDGQG